VKKVTSLVVKKVLVERKQENIMLMKEISHRKGMDEEIVFGIECVCKFVKAGSNKHNQMLKYFLLFVLNMEDYV